MKISVVISVYNGVSYVDDAINSILGQSEKSLELIVINDGSTDGTALTLSRYSDPRIQVINLPHNCGIATARNVAMSCLNGDYLAVMDADDLSLPARLESQLSFLDNNPGVHIVGGRIIRTSEDLESEIDRPEHPCSDGEIKANLLLLNGSAMIHPTMMARMSFIKEHSLMYPPPPRGRVGIDHEFWIKCVARGAVFENIPEIILLKRRHSENVTLLNNNPLISQKKKLSRTELLSLYYPELTARESRALAALFELNSQLKILDVSLGLAAGQRALLDDTSHYGESKPHLRLIIEDCIARWLEALASRTDS
jgi:glycosyltransferase involved in cell wall biosynthesis